MSKLQNVKALKEMLQGEHRTQNRKTHGFSNTKDVADRSKVRTVGEVWQEINALGESVCWWKQEDGYRVKHTMHPDVVNTLKQLKEYLLSFPNCPKEVCTCASPTRIDEKFKRLMGMCEDCVISMETSLKIKGEFNEYAINKIKGNAESFFKQADVEVQILKEQLKNTSFVNSEQGDVENWSMDNIDEFLAKIDADYQIFKDNLYKKIEGSIEPSENQTNGDLNDNTSKD